MGVDRQYTSVEKAIAKLKMLGIQILDSNDFAIIYAGNEETMKCLIVSEDRKQSNLELSIISNPYIPLPNIVKLTKNFIIFRRLFDLSNRISIYAIGDRKKEITFKGISYDMKLIELADCNTRYHDYATDELIVDRNEDFLVVTPRISTETDTKMDHVLGLISKSGKAVQINGVPRHIYAHRKKSTAIEMLLSCICTPNKNGEDLYTVCYRERAAVIKKTYLIIPLFEFTGDFNNMHRIDVHTMCSRFRASVEAANKLDFPDTVRFMELDINKTIGLYYDSFKDLEISSVIE